nr:hypothetical protein BaRGS_016532 [Batillaria attramentaria]
MRPDGLDNFYQKYTEAYGIPILGRFAIIGDNEVTKDIPEFHNIDDYMNNRTRGLGAMVSNPVSTGAEENILCESQDRWHPEDIFLHEVAHTVDNLGATMVIPGWHQDLQKVYDHAKAAGLWDNTYAMTDPDEYFAEGVQSFFNVNDRATPTNGIHNDVDTQAELKLYDRELYDLILTVFPCNNHYLKRCESTRHTSNGHDGCQDEQTVECIGWAIDGECEANPSWMLNHCKASCKTCRHMQRRTCISP